MLFNWLRNEMQLLSKPWKLKFVLEKYKKYFTWEKYLLALKVGKD